MTTILLAILIGTAFGFVLDRIGATNPGLIIKMLNLSDLHLMKAILLGIGIASVLMFSGLLLGFLDPGHMSVKTAYTGVFVGGLLLGLGFAVAGYCPGTGLTAAAAGRFDALFFIVGGLAGAAAYIISYETIKERTGLLDKIAGGKTTLGTIDGTKYTSLIDGVSGEWLGLLLGAIFILIAIIVPRHYSSKNKIVKQAVHH